LKLLEVTHAVRDSLRAASIDNAALDAQLLAASVLGIDRISVLASPELKLSEKQTRDILSLAQRRQAHEPMAYILGHQEFYSLSFSITPDVLIPRPETELLVDLALSCLPQKAHKTAPAKILDLGTGSGCIAVAVSYHAKASHETPFILAIDSCPRALALAEYNAAKNGVSGNIVFQNCNILDDDLPTQLINQSFDIIISNPPYIPKHEFPVLPTSVREFEPKAALFGGEDGLNFYRALGIHSKTLLHPGGRIMLEVGKGQSTEVSSLLSAYGLADINVIKDLSGIERVVTARKNIQ